MIAQLIPDFGGIAGDVDVEIAERGASVREVLKRAVIAVDQRGTVHMEQVAEHQAMFDQTVHVVAFRFVSTRSRVRPGTRSLALHASGLTRGLLPNRLTNAPGQTRGLSPSKDPDTPNRTPCICQADARPSLPPMGKGA